MDEILSARTYPLHFKFYLVTQPNAQYGLEVVHACQTSIDSGLEKNKTYDGIDQKL